MKPAVRGVRISLSKLQTMLAPVVYADLAARVEAARCAVLTEKSAALADD